MEVCNLDHSFYLSFLIYPLTDPLVLLLCVQLLVWEQTVPQRTEPLFVCCIPQTFASCAAALCLLSLLPKGALFLFCKHCCWLRCGDVLGKLLRPPPAVPLNFFSGLPLPLPQFAFLAPPPCSTLSGFPSSASFFEKLWLRFSPATLRGLYWRAL